MKIKLTTSLAGAEVLPAGSIINTTEDEARRLVAAGFAVWVDETPAPKAETEAKQDEQREVKEATSKEFVKRETTAGRKRKPRRRKK